MKNKLKLTKDGFTIIEVMIVLAIAGLIMLIVFLAVPALQRNSRNTQYRAEAGQILSASTEWSTNNGGAVPQTSISTTAGTHAAQIMGLVKTQQIGTLVVEPYSGTTSVTLQQAVLRTGAKCGSGTGAAYTTVQGGSRSVALIFPVEDASGQATAVCQES